MRTVFFKTLSYADEMKLATKKGQHLKSIFDNNGLDPIELEYKLRQVFDQSFEHFQKKVFFNDLNELLSMKQEWAPFLLQLIRQFDKEFKDSMLNLANKVANDALYQHKKGKDLKECLLITINRDLNRPLKHSILFRLIDYPDSKIKSIVIQLLNEQDSLRL